MPRSRHPRQQPHARRQSQHQSQNQSQNHQQDAGIRFSSRDLGGRPELGQNLLIDPAVATTMADALGDGFPRPVVELGAGTGAITRALVATGRPVTAVELDPRYAASLREQYSECRNIQIFQADMLAFRDQPYPHDVVSNVPFGITTPLLRRLLDHRCWHTAVLLLQWEVARKRAAIGGTTMMTAAWWPWYTFRLAQRVPAAAFRPRPSVDAGILIIARRDQPLVADPSRESYQRLVHRAFTGPGRDLPAVLNRWMPSRITSAWMRREGLPPRTLARDLVARQWASLWHLHQEVTARPRMTRPHN